MLPAEFASGGAAVNYRVHWRSHRLAYTYSLGGVLLSAHCDTSEQIDRAKAILKRTGAADIASAGEEAVGAGASNRDAKRI